MRTVSSLQRSLASTILVSGLVLTASAGAATMPQVDAHGTKSRKLTTFPSGKLAGSRPVSGASTASVHGAGAPRQLAKASEEVSVSAHQARSREAQDVVTTAAILQSASGTSVLKALAAVPGVNFQSSDPFGQDSWASSTYLRGFASGYIGATLDGMPLLQNPGSIQFNAAIIPDNVGSVSVTQGSGAESVASTTDLGGAFQITSSDPTDRRGGNVSQMFGSNNSFRTFVRLDSGSLNHTGTKFYVSYARIDTDLWKGAGNQFGQQVNAKLVQPVGEASKISAFFGWDQTVQHTYQDMSFETLHKLGYNLSYYYPNYALAYNIAEGNYPSSYADLSSPETAAYYDAVQSYATMMGGVKGDFVLSDRLKLNTTFYGKGIDYDSVYNNPFNPSPNGAPLSESSQPSTEEVAYGFTSNLIYNIAHNSIQTGVWYENDQERAGSYIWQEPVLGQGQPIDASNGKPDFPPFATPYVYHFNTNTFQYHFQDDYRPIKSLDIHFGFKSLLQTTNEHAVQNDPAYTGTTELPHGSLTTSSAFLPHVGIDWHPLTGHEFYFDASNNKQTFGYSGFQLGSPWGVSDQAVFKELQKTIKPESNWSYVLGYRFDSRYVSANLDLYRVNFFNRLAGISTGTVVNPQSTLTNAGGVTNNGVDASLTIRPISGLSITNSVSYNDSRYDQNFVNSGIVYPVKGKHVVGYPPMMYHGNIVYQFGNADVHMDANYYGSRPFSYLNDVSIPPYWLVNAGISYRVPHTKWVRGLKFQFNVYNLTNNRYIGQAGEAGFPMSGDLTSFMVGAPRQFFGTVSAEF
ncbi:TonB-dependent receptor domain-containing protein [Nguyenibacter sp. L1]|uniref:TonB-dependent receptor n=1 Tax=Nguyenibacter sp. L1 TaxID=3049350 RepID=UPI002B477B89|nr:TonB-dependent receptor [Nguyenibacter sp. L1]WRH89792.1 TonB-dependent receptor [Nguyenibacter sp. L1]